MIPRPFSVVVESIGEAARPVLAVNQDGELLTVRDDNTLVWVSPDECRLASVFYGRDEMVTPPWAAELGWGGAQHSH